MAGLQLLDQIGLLLGLAALLVDGGQLDVADIGAVQGGLADLLHLIQVLVVGALGAIQQDLGQPGLG